VTLRIDVCATDAYAAALMGAKKRTSKTAAKNLTQMIAIRVTTEDTKLLDDLAERLPVASRHAIAREALRIGLAALDDDPTQLVRASTGGAKRERVGRSKR